MMELQQMRITVMGAGAIGKLAAARLAKHDFNVKLLVRREEQARLLNTYGIGLAEEDAKQQVPIQATTDFFKLQSDLVIVTVKSFDTQTAAKQIAEMPGKPIVLSLQNGLGNDQILSSILEEDRVLLGVTTYGATSISDNEVAARGQGELVIGRLGHADRGLKQVRSLFSEAGWQVRIPANIQKDIWQKALINVGINPLTAIYRVTNGEILNRSDLRETAMLAVQEAGNVAIRLGILSEYEVGQGTDRMLEVCRLTAMNRSSMLQDVEKGRKTEIDSLNGAIVRFGETLGIETPVNRRVTEQILQI